MLCYAGLNEGCTMNCPVCGRYGEPDSAAGYDGSDTCPDCKAAELNGPVTLTNHQEGLKTECTELRSYSERCLNPLCGRPIAPNRKHAPVKFYCCAKCRQAASIIRRASRLLAGVSWEEALWALRMEKTEPRF